MSDEHHHHRSSRIFRDLPPSAPVGSSFAPVEGKTTPPERNPIRVRHWRIRGAPALSKITGRRPKR